MYWPVYWVNISARFDLRKHSKKMSLSDLNNVQDEKREHHNHTPIDQDDIEEQERAHFQKVINALRFYRYEIIGV